MLLEARPLPRVAARASRLADLFSPATIVLFAGARDLHRIEQAHVDGGFAVKFVDLAINHWDTAVGVHELDHPMTRADESEVDPDSLLPGR